MTLIERAKRLYSVLTIRGIDEEEAAELVDYALQDAHVYNHSDQHQSSAEIGQTAKGEWYVKSVKLYFEDDAGADEVGGRLEGYREAAENSLPGDDECS